MPRRAGELAIRPKAAHVYFIVVASRFIYIGETQVNPAQRWGDHLSSQGTLKTNLGEVDDEVLAGDAVMHFFAYECAEVASLPQYERKLMTQFVEHQLHVRVVEDLVLGPRLRIVSDTTRTTPRRVRQEAVGSALVESVFAMFREDASRVMPTL